MPDLTRTGWLLVRLAGWELPVTWWKPHAEKLNWKSFEFYHIMTMTVNMTITICISTISTSLYLYSSMTKCWGAEG